MTFVPGSQLWRLSFDAAGGDPELPRRRDGIYGLSIPPGLFVAKAMVVPVMGSAQRYGELVADLASDRAGLSEPQMVGVSGASPANKTRL